MNGPDGPVADSSDGYKIMPEEHEWEEDLMSEKSLRERVDALRFDLIAKRANVNAMGSYLAASAFTEAIDGCISILAAPEPAREPEIAVGKHVGKVVGEYVPDTTPAIPSQEGLREKFLETAATVMNDYLQQHIDHINADLLVADMADGMAKLILALLPSDAGLRKALESIAKNTCCDTCYEAAIVARAALARAEGGGKGNEKDSV